MSKYTPIVVSNYEKHKSEIKSKLDIFVRENLGYSKHVANVYAKDLYKYFGSASIEEITEVALELGVSVEYLGKQEVSHGIFYKCFFGRDFASKYSFRII